MNSPGSARRPPHAQTVLTKASTIAGFPWEDISTTSSPVYDSGPRKSVTRQRSIMFSSRSFKEERVTHRLEKTWPPDNLDKILRAPEPLIRILATPLCPYGVVGATIVSPGVIFSLGVSPPPFVFLWDSG